MCVHLKTTLDYMLCQYSNLCSVQIAAMRSDLTMVSIARVFELFAELHVPLGEQLESYLQVLASYSCKQCTATQQKVLFIPSVLVALSCDTAIICQR